MELVVALLIFVSFLLSASCGLGGSLILIPSLSILFGIKESIIISSLLLAMNNLVKVCLFRKSIQLLPVGGLLVCIAGGASLGALLLLKMDEKLITPIFILHVVFSFIFQRNKNLEVRKKVSLAISFVAGLLSGVAGSAGPLKGIALKCHVFTKTELVAAASLLSFVTDLTKSAIYLPATYSQLPWGIVWYSLLVMPIATALGRYLNRRMSETAYDALFYSVMSGYVLRLLI